MPRFYQTSNEDYRLLVSWWTSLKTLFLEEYRQELTQSEKDLITIQKVVDDELIDIEDELSIECLGVTMGRILVNTMEELDWWIIKEKQKRIKVVRMIDTNFYLDPVSILKEKMAKESKPNLNDIYFWMKDEMIRNRNER